MNSSKYDLISSNKHGRCLIKKFKQYEYPEPLEILLGK